MTDVDAAILAELDRRRKLIESGEMTLSPWEEVEARIYGRQAAIRRTGTSHATQVDRRKRSPRGVEDSSGVTIVAFIHNHQDTTRRFPPPGEETTP